jgi:predicted phage terminase large subunit-like protein
VKDILSWVLKRDYKSFLIKSFYTLHHNERFEDNWHLDLITEYLQAIAKGDIKRLIINIPPRSLKSICTSVAWPAWLLAQNPANKIISASYSQALSNKHGMDCRKIILSNWYKECFPDTVIVKGQNTKNKFLTEYNGFRFATSIGGTLTGEGADFLIVDDPLTPLQALSSSFRNRANIWFEQTFTSRLNDKKRGAIVIVMQRLHVNDLTGFLNQGDKEEWHLLNIPMVATKNEDIIYGDFNYKRVAGEYLHIKRDGEKEILNLKKTMGSYAFEAQYQQNPVPLDGGIIKKSWLQYYMRAPEFEAIYQSWDCAIKVSQNNDYSVCTTWGVYNGNYYLIDVVKARFEYPMLKKEILLNASKYKPSALIIEDKASGQQLIQDLHCSGLNIIKYMPKFDKMTRLIITSHIFESGRILLPHNKDWLNEFIHELTIFPNAEHDDQIDSSTQFLGWIENHQKHKSNFTVRRL